MGAWTVDFLTRAFVGYIIVLYMTVFGLRFLLRAMGASYHLVGWTFLDYATVAAFLMVALLVILAFPWFPRRSSG